MDKLAYKLRFSVEEELKIYEALLNSAQRKRDERLPIDDSQYRQAITTKRYTDTISSGESTGFRRTPPTQSETTRIFTSQTRIDDTPKYRPPPLPSIVTETTTTKTVKQSDSTTPAVRRDPVEKPSTNWSYETITSGTTSSARDDSTDRDRSAERSVVPARPDADRYAAGGIQSLVDQNRTTTTTTRTTRRFGHGGTGQQQQQAGGKIEQRGTSSSRREETAIASHIPEVDEKFLQSKIHITRKYKGKRRCLLFSQSNLCFRKCSHKIC